MHWVQYVVCSMYIHCTHLYYKRIAGKFGDLKYLAICRQKAVGENKYCERAPFKESTCMLLAGFILAVSKQNRQFAKYKPLPKIFPLYGTCISLLRELLNGKERETYDRQE